MNFKIHHRFFCPPPCIYLTGDGWRESRKRLERLYREHYPSSGTEDEDKSLKSAVDCTGGVEGDMLSAAGHGSVGAKQSFDLCAFIGIGGGSSGGGGMEHSERQQLDFSSGKDYCAAKTLF